MRTGPCRHRFPALCALLACVALGSRALADDEQRVIVVTAPAAAASLATPAPVPLAAAPRRERIPAALQPADLLQRARSSAAAPREGVDALDPAYLTINAPAGMSGYGYSVSGVGDVNFDGYADIMVSTSMPGGTGYGVYLYYGSATGPSLSSAWSLENLPMPVRVGAAGDVNGDGFDDVLFCSDLGTLEVHYGSVFGPSVAPNFSTSKGPYRTSAMTAGDINGDGYDDVILGVPQLDRVFIYRGSASGLSVFNVIVLDSPESGASFGQSVAGAGDINADGFDDVVVGAPDALDDDFSPGGAVFVYLGSGSGLMSGPTPFQKYTMAAQPLGNLGDLGWSVAPAGDYDGDGYADVLVGDPLANFGPDAYHGIAMLLQGSPSGLGGGLIPGAIDPYLGTDEGYGGNVFTAGDVNGDGLGDALVVATGEAGNPGNLTLFEGGAGTIVQRVLGLVGSGTVNAATAGDVNGDGFSDVIIGIPESGSGRVRVYYGKAGTPCRTPAAVRYGGAADELSGWSVATGDLNGDGFDDVVVGNPNHDVGAHVNAGAVHIYFGGPGGIGATPDMTIEGYLEGLGGDFGIHVDAGGDVNGDGYGDLLVGAHLADRVYLFFGSPTGPRLDFYDIIYTPIPSQLGACAAFAGDVNGDGYCDLLTGSPEYDQTTPVATTNGGRVTLWLGGYYLPSLSSWKPTANQSNAREGTWVASAGDVNNDGYADVVISTGYYDGPPGADCGHARIYLGGPGGLSNTASAEWFGPAASQFGYECAGIGDLNGDGYGDVAVGAPDAGTVSVGLGGPGGVEAAPSLSYPAPQPFTAFGCSVAPAGDVNGDGYSDFIAGAVFADGAGGSDCGQAYVYTGGVSPSTAPYVTFEGVGTAANLGHAVAGGGDVNGDGFGDLVTGCPRELQSYLDEGSFRFFLGNSAHVSASTVPVSGQAAPAQTMRPDFLLHPLATYDRTSQPTHVGFRIFARSAGGRDRVAANFRVGPVGVNGISAWSPMGNPWEALGGAAKVNFQLAGLTPNTRYAWQSRTLSRSPYFRFGAWHDPQQNARGQWDFRTAPGNVGVAPPAALPATVELARPFPNPASAGVSLAFALPHAMPVRLAVRDLQGRMVRMLADGGRDAGRQTVRWDGADAAGRRCAAGLYFIDLEAGGERRTGHVVLTP